MRWSAHEKAIIECLYRADYPAFSRMLMREDLGSKYVCLRGNECFNIIYDSLDAFARGEIKQLLHHLPPGHLRTTLAITVALFILAKYPQRHIAYIVSDRDTAMALVQFTKRLLSLSKLRALFPHLAYRRKSTQFLFHSGGSISFFVFRSPFNVDLVDTIILDEPQKTEDARDTETARADQEYVKNHLLATREEKQILLLSSRMSGDDLVAAFDFRPLYDPALANDVPRQIVFPYNWPAVSREYVPYFGPNGTWVRPEFHVLCPELYSFADQVDIARRLGSFEYLTRYLQMPSGIMSETIRGFSPQDSYAMPPFQLIGWIFGLLGSPRYSEFYRAYYKERGLGDPTCFQIT